jgi:nicotinate-nucleotide pyrophosphorylase (carboxylating)
MSNYLTPEAIDQFIDQALKEDIGPGDYTSLASVPVQAHSKAELLIKDTGILAGVQLAGQIFNKVDSDLQITTYLKDGAAIKPGDIALEVKGKARSILSAERLVLNCMQRMSGIATHTHELNQLISPYKAKLLDTRKTTPNFRIMEKWAVKIGGGTNHRFALYDMIMIKDNHVDYAGGISKAITDTKQYLKDNNLDLKIEVETRNLEEVREVLSHKGIAQIMLDNFDIDTLTEAVLVINGQCLTEASGGITETTIASVAATGVDYISVGALTHSTISLDMSLKATKD